MRLIVISDTHDNLAWLDKALEMIENFKVDGLVHCGDVQTVDTLVYLCTKFIKPVWVAYDPPNDHLEDLVNHRIDWPKNLKSIHQLIEISAAALAATHRLEEATNLAASGKYKYVCYGHSHLPWDKQEGGVRIFNPGNLCGVRARPSFATLDTETDDLQLYLV